MLDKFSGDGFYCRIVEEKFEEMYQVPKVLLTNSCSSALDICSRLLEHDEKNEIIVPGYTFVTSVSHFAERNFKLRFCDINEKDLCLDLNKIRKLINEKTLAIVVTNYSGINSQIQEIAKVARENNIILIEDNAQGFNSRNSGRLLGTFGDLSVLSFHETKNLSSGEGGALLINNDEFMSKAIKLRDKGTNRRDFDHNIVKKYEWQENGSNFYMTEFNAIVLNEELRQFDKNQERRRKLWLNYHFQISKLCIENKFDLPEPELYRESNYHCFYLKFKNENLQTQFIKYMKSLDIDTPFHYQDLSVSAKGIGYFAEKRELNSTGSIVKTLVRLPLYHSLSYKKQSRVIKSIGKFLKINSI
jgi:dTDP-4-amino-4,6-dideoxygalactose transaminase